MSENSEWLDRNEAVMKRCQAGTNNYEKANELHAECYGTIGKATAELRRHLCPCGHWLREHGDAFSTGKWACMICRCDDFVGSK